MLVLPLRLHEDHINSVNLRSQGSCGRIQSELGTFAEGYASARNCIVRSNILKVTQDDSAALTTFNCPSAGASSDVKHMLW
jgi:hypothetical protein